MTKLERSFDVSRDPSDYSKTIHYKEAKRKRVMVEDDVVNEAISEGDIERVDSDGVAFRLNQKFLTLEVVVSREGGVIETAYEVES